MKIFQVDAFTAEPFSGNPAVVCILEEPQGEDWMLKVALEMNLSETAFLLPQEDSFGLRWFTPTTEVDLCGHATLAPDAVVPTSTAEEIVPTENPIPEADSSQIEADALGIYTSDITTPDGEVIGEASLERSEKRETLTFAGCCLIPGNAYTIWWVTGPVEVPMEDAPGSRAAGFIADKEEFDLVMERGTFFPLEGLRAVALDHGPDTGDQSQIISPEGGCEDMCPTVLTATFPSPLENEE